MDLSDFFKTKAQATDFSARLSTMLEAAYKTGFSLEKALMEQFGIEKKDKFISLLRENNISIDSPATLKEFITKLQESITALPTLPIVIAFEPKEQTLKTLSDWFFLNMKKQVLFDIKVDKALLAGATVTFNGKFLDFSVKAKFDQIVKTILEKPVNQAVENTHIGR